MATDILRKRAIVLKAMGHPSRLAILEALALGERCVGDLQAIVGSDFSTVSRHLSVLKNAGIIADRKQGAQVFYSLRVPCVLNFFGCVDAVLGVEPWEAGEAGACGLTTIVR
ncbi:MAG: ArsR/SmtB family transcription factor [Chloroflexota bacterium]